MVTQWSFQGLSTALERVTRKPNLSVMLQICILVQPRHNPSELSLLMSLKVLGAHCFNSTTLYNHIKVGAPEAL